VVVLLARPGRFPGVSPVSCQPVSYQPVSGRPGDSRFAGACRAAFGVGEDAAWFCYHGTYI